MKKTIALFLAVALLGVGLIVSCSDDPEPEKKPDPGTDKPAVPGNFKVTFDPDGGTFVETESAAIYGITVKEGDAVGVLPDVERGTDQFLGWFEFGNTTAYTSSSKITKDVYLKASWGIPKFTAVGPNAVTHDNFLITVSPGGTHSTWDGTELGENKFTFKVGGVQYKFPESASFDYTNYDFVDVEYTASDVNSLTYKQYGSSDGYTAFAGSISATTGDEKKVITYELRKATASGFAIQKWAAGDADMTIQFTKVTFRKGTRYTIKFDPDGGSAVPDNYLVDGTTVANHLPTNTTKANKIFAGWLYKTAIGTGDSAHAAGSPVGASHVVSSAYSGITLKAYWLDAVTVSPIEPTFADLTGLKFYDKDSSDKFKATALTGANAGKGFKIEGFNWQWRFVTFKITIPANATLAHYNTVTFDFDQTQTGAYYKNVFLLAAPVDGADKFVNPPSDIYYQSKMVADKVTSENKTSLTFTINKPAASAFTAGQIEVGIMVEAGDDKWYGISNIKFE